MDRKSSKQQSDRGILLRQLILRCKEVAKNLEIPRGGKKSKSNIGIDQVVAELLQSHPEYRRKKPIQFKKDVERAYTIAKKDVCQEYELQMMEQAHLSSRRTADDDDEESSDDRSSSEDDLALEGSLSEDVKFLTVDDRSGNALNRRIQQTYRTQIKEELPNPATSSSSSAVVETPHENDMSKISASTATSNTPSKGVPKSDATESSTSVIPAPREDVSKERRSRDRTSSASTPGSKRAGKRRKVASGSGTSSKKEDGFSSGPPQNEAIYRVERPRERYSDLGGMEATLQDIREVVELMFTHIELFSHLGTDPPHGVLMHGPPGCGKTLLAHAIAGELDVPLFKVSAPALVGSASGDSEKKIRSIFEQAVEECRVSPRGCIILIDEIDVITPKRETANREMERRMVAQLLSCMDELSLEQCGGKPVLVIGATNRPDAIDTALRRAGRFDREIGVPVPEKAAREHILRVMCANLRMAGDFDFAALATCTPGYVGADFRALVNEAALIAVTRGFADVESIAGGLAVGLPGNVKSGGVAGNAADVVAMDVGANDADDAVNASNSHIPPSMAPVANGTVAADSHTTRVGTNVLPMGTNALPVGTAPVTVGKNALPVGATAVTVGATPGSEATSISGRGAASDALRAQQEPFSAEALSGLYVTAADFEAALPRVQPSAKREGFATIPEVTWDDVGALGNPRRELEDAIVLPLKYPDLSRRMGIPRPPGVLLYGPPGCGKTLLAKAVASGTHANFISVKGPELLNKFVGESERAVRLVFQRARTSSPCIVFFDEFDALCPVRDNDSSSRNTQRIVNQLLTEMDGFDASSTQQDKLVYVDVPNAEAREEILRTQTRKLLLADDVNLRVIASDAYTTGFTGADLAAVTREAGTLALRRVVLSMTDEQRSGGVGGDDMPVMSITANDIASAVRQVSPSVSAKDLRRYRGMQGKLRGKRGNIGATSSNSESATHAANASDAVPQDGVQSDNTVDPPEVDGDRTSETAS